MMRKTSNTASPRHSATGDGEFQGEDKELRRRTGLVLALGAVLVLSHAFVPFEKFIHRSDDAFYYFQIAVNFAEHGHWTFDGLHPTNGVQPLWGLILTVVAAGLDLVGLHDKYLIARLFVGLAAVANIASAFILFRLLARQVSTGTGIAAAGAFLLPMGIVWQRTWGMESGLYAFMLVATVAYYHVSFLQRPDSRRAVLLGLLLGLTALSRLNAGILIPVLLLHLLFFSGNHTFASRLRLAFLAGVLASLVVGLYFAHNWLTTEHLLPVSATAKSIRSELSALGRDIDGPLTVIFWKHVYWGGLEKVLWFVTSRLMDGMWIAGSRLLFYGDSGVPLGTLALYGGAVVILPLCVGQPRQWFRFLMNRLRHVSVFWYVLVFGAINALTSVMFYPDQLDYAMVKWWLIENEIVLSVLSATIAAAAVAFVGRRFVPVRHQRIVAPIAIFVMILAQGTFHVKHYWVDDRTVYDWNPSGNDQWYLAAQWIEKNIPETELIGAWNAGIIGYFSNHRVVNLDGLINGFDYLPYLRDDRIEDYIKDRGIGYIADMHFEFRRSRITERIRTVLIYENFSEFYQGSFYIYEVNE
ncbi:MAG: glycosyltransferase family 39 protein [Alphaproteobacteria bacterium]